MPDFKLNYPPVVAAFDFDHTLIDRDSLLPFLFYAVGITRTLCHLAQLTPDFIQYGAGIKTRQQIKESILTHFFKGREISELRKKGQNYAEKRLDAFIKKEAWERLQWHQKQNHHCVIVSASVDLYLIPWAKRYGIETVISSQLEIAANGLITGQLQGKNCWGAEKVRRLIEKFGPRAGYQLYAYGDSRGDKELLECADFGFYRKFE